MAYAAKAFRDAATIRFRHPNQLITIPTHSRHLSELSKINSTWLDQSSDFTLKDESTNYTYNLCEPKDQHELLQQEQQQLIARIQQLIAQKEISKHQRIRIKEWVSKLSQKQTNPVWKKNVVFYLRTLAEMMREGSIGWPFSSLPTEGPLPKLSIYDVPYPLRQRLSQPKQHGSNPTHKKPTTKTSFGHKRPTEQKAINKSKEAKLLKDLGLLKGFDFNQTTILDKKVSLGLNHSRPIKFDQLHKDKQSYFQFEEERIQMSVAMQSNYSSKARKEHLQTNSHKHSGKNKMQNLKVAKENPSGSLRDDQADKENNPHAVNVSRKLFRSKEKTLGCSNNGLKAQYSQRPRCETFKSSEEGHIFGFSYSDGVSDRDDNCQQPTILGKMFKMLQDNETALADKPSYCQLLQEIKAIGKQMQLPQFAELGLDESTLSQDSKAFLRVREEIKQKFQQTDNETLEFMKYLQRARAKDKHASY